MGGVLPQQTAAAADECDRKVLTAAATLLRTDHSPPERAALATACFDQAAANGGLGVGAHRRSRRAHFVATFFAVLPSLTASFPSPAALDVAAVAAAANTTFATLTAVGSSWTATVADVVEVRRCTAALAALKAHWVDGTVHPAFHPRIAPQLALPSLAKALADPKSTPTFRSVRKLAAVSSVLAWLSVKRQHDAFDAANVGSSSHRREGARLVSYSQPGSGAALDPPT